MKIKVIDILNKIANGEEVPKKIYYLEETFTYDEQSKDYYDNETYGLFDRYEIPSMLNDEVEILETNLNTKNMNINGIEQTKNIIKQAINTIIPNSNALTNIDEIINSLSKHYELRPSETELLINYINDLRVLKQSNKIEKLNIALFDDDNLTTDNKLKHIAFRINEIIEVLNER